MSQPFCQIRAETLHFVIAEFLQTAPPRLGLICRPAKRELGNESVLLTRHVWEHLGRIL
jgi:hypothetical protein